MSKGRRIINEYMMKRVSSAFSLNTVMAIILFIVLVLNVSPAFAGFTWTQQSASGSRNWSAIASSTDGTKLAAVVSGGYIYTSTDSGATWTEQTSAGSRDWRSIASSADGTKLVAGVKMGYIYTSTDSGITWTEQTAAESRCWYAIASSADGTKLAAAAGCGDHIYTSADSGVTWTQRTAGSNGYWQSITSSADGTKLAAVEMFGGNIYTSTDSGLTWTNRYTAGNLFWYSIASSADGTKLAAVDVINQYGYGGHIYTSTDSGATWTEHAINHDWRSIASSADGTKLAAGAGDGNEYVYISTDSGETWIEQITTGNHAWQSIAMSADGKKLAACGTGLASGSYYGEYIWTGTDTSDTTPDAFSFTDQTDVALSTVITSNTITVTGIDEAVAISITGGEYSVSTDGGTTWSEYSTAVPSTVSLNDQITVRQTSSAIYSTTTDATLTIGGVSDTFSVTTQASATITTSVDGRSGPWNDTLNPSYPYGTFSSGADNVNLDPTVISSSSGLPMTPGNVLTVSYVSGQVNVGNNWSDAGGLTGTTTSNDYPGTPADYLDSVDKPANLMELLGVFAHDGVIVGGKVYKISNGPKTLTIPSGANQLLLGMTDSWYNDNGGAVTIQISEALDTIQPTITSAISSTTDGSYTVGSEVNITLNFAEEISTTGLAITLNTGAVINTGALNNVMSWSGTYTIGVGHTSGDLTITSISGAIADLSSNSTVDPVIPAGQNIGDGKAIVIAVNGACGSSDGGTFTSAPDANLCNDGNATAVTGTGPWSWTCEGQNGGTNASCSAQLDDTTPETFTFTDRTGVALNTVVTSNTITVSGINAAAAISITGGEYSVSSDGGTTWSEYSTSVPSTVSLNDKVMVRQTSSASYSTTTDAALTIGGVSDTFSVTTQAVPVPDSWTQKENFGGVARWHATGFSIGTKGYIGTGAVSFSDYTNDFWEYDSTLNTWTQKADFGGKARFAAVGFAIGSKGYIGTGYDGSTYYKDFWEYDPATNTWTQKSDLGGEERFRSVGFSFGNKGYIGTGFCSGSGVGCVDFWEYDPAADTWVQKADLGGSGRYCAVGFSIGSKGYIGTGIDSSYSKVFWEYNPAANSWTQKADFGGVGRYGAVGFSIGSKGYIGTGYSSSGGQKSDFWEYEPTDTTPDAFSFTDQTDVALSTVITSNTITVTGIDEAAAISITGGEYSVSSDGGTTWSEYSTAVPSTVSLNDQVKVRQTSSASYSTTMDATLTIGGVSDTFSVTTQASATITTSVDGRSGPWNDTLNPSYPYGTFSSGADNVNLDPTVISSSSGLPMTPGNVLTVSYVSGQVFSGADWCDAGGVVGTTDTSGSPADYLAAADKPANLMELLGVFAHDGVIVDGKVYKIGNGPKTLTIPTGANQLLLGVTDGWYNDNSGTVTVQVTEALDNIQPTITSATSSTADGSYTAGSEVNITLNFSEQISSTGLAITLNTGAVITTGALNNAIRWSGTYTIGAGQTSGDLAITSISGAIVDLSSNSTVDPVIPAGQNIGDGKAIVVAVNGACGSSNGGTFTSAPDANLCNDGNATAVTGTGPWSWTCEGQNGGTNASCSAQYGVQKIVYSKQEPSGNYDLWMMDPDGSNKQRLTNEAKDGISSTFPSIFPNGEKILYLRGGANIAVLDIKTLAVTMLTTDGVDGSYAYSWPRLSADGTKITYEYGQHIGGSCSACQTLEIYMMDADGTNKVRMTDNSYRDTTPIFSPDGTKLLITQAQYTSGDCCNATDVYIMDIATKAETLLYGSSVYDWGYDWNNAGIIFTLQSGEVKRINPDGTGLATLLDSSKGAVSAIYSPSGSRILYASNSGSTYILFTTDTDGLGSNPVQLTSDMNVDYNFAWGYVTPDSLTVDTTPDAFSLTDQTDVALSTEVTSNSITVAGINTAAVISITDGEYSINGGEYIGASGTVYNGDTITVRQTSSASYSTTTDATLTIGGVSDTFSVTTLKNPALLVTITIDPDPDSLNAPWTLTGPDTFSASNNGDVVVGNLDPGDYTVTWGDVAGWDKPSPSSQTLDAGDSITITGTYHLIPVVPAPPTGGAVGGTITLNGSNFGATQGGGYVDFNGVHGTIVSWSDTQIVVNVPAGATSGCMIVVTDYGTSSCMTFSVVKSAKNDFNADGISDLLWRNDVTGQINLWFMNADGTSSALKTLITDLTWTVAGTGDFNADGITDILWRQASTGKVNLWFMKADGTRSSTKILITDPSWTVAGTGDFNGDDTADIIWIQSSTGKAVLWFMNADGTRSSTKTLITDPTWTVAKTCDFNNDGIADIIWRQSSTGKVVLWIMNNNGTRASTKTLITDKTWTVGDTGAMNADDITDIIWRQASTGKVLLWFMNADGTRSTTKTLITDKTWTVAGTGTFNTDGISDILWRQSSTGKTLLWFMNADGTRASYRTLMTDPNWTIVGQ